MKIHPFDNYEQYLDTERRGSRYRPNRGANAIEEETKRIVGYFHARKDRSLLRVLCHGARAGVEVRQFKQWIPKDAEVIGTDVYAADLTCVVEWDFNLPKPEWVGTFDAVYSNSLDHSPEPGRTLSVWIEQLKPDGLLFLVWTFAHTLEDRPTLPYPGGDCFGGALHEYIRLVKGAGGVIEDLLWCPVERNNDHVVIVASPKGK